MTAGDGPVDHDLWVVLDQTRPDRPDPVAHAGAIAEVLATGPPERIVAHARAFEEAVRALYRWDLWGAAYLVLGGCSDDAFADVRAWLVAQGEATWTRARTDPEALFLELLADSDDPTARWEALGLDLGEHLAYAAAVAHERLTGQPLPPSGGGPPPADPEGEPWDEDALPARFPRLAAALPQGWLEPDAEPGLDDRWTVHDQVLAGIEAYLGGDHHLALGLLEPVFADPQRWAMLADPVDVAYVVGISRLLEGDPDGAADALRRVAGGSDLPAHVRRALAQVELARGELGAAAALLEDGRRADLLDRALLALVALRRGDAHEARRRAAAVARRARPRRGDHPWDVAGALSQAGSVLVELGDGRAAGEVASAVLELIRDSPPTLPLRVQYAALAAGALRLEGRFSAAAEALEWTEPLLGDGTADRAIVEREWARLDRAQGDDAGAAHRYAAAIEAFDRAGERWEAAATREEAAGSGPQ
jgi:hypothetical protein